MGPITSLPWGFLLLTVIGIIVMAIIGAILWKTMYHDEFDDVDIDQRPPFVLPDDQ